MFSVDILRPGSGFTRKGRFTAPKRALKGKVVPFIHQRMCFRGSVTGCFFHERTPLGYIC